MKNKFWSVLLLTALLLVIALPQPARAANSAREPGDEFVFGGSYTLESGETLEGDLLIFGGSAELEPRSVVAGSVTLMGGTLRVGGVVEEDILGMGGAISIEPSAQVLGDVTILGANLSGDTSRIEGEITIDSGGLVRFNFPGNMELPVGLVFNPIWAGLSFLFTLFVLSALAIGVTLFLPRHTERVTQAISAQPAAAGGMGCLTLVALPFVLTAMAVTLILIPAIPLALLALAALVVLGWTALGSLVGGKLGVLLKTQWHPAVAAGIGTFALAFVTVGMAWLPCIGWLAPTAVTVIGLGAALLTRFGMREPGASPTPPPAPASLPAEPLPSPGGEIPPSLPPEPPAAG